MAAGSPKREEDGAQKARVAHVAWRVGWAVCSRVGVGENGQQAEEEEVDTLTRARVDHEEAERWTRDPGRGEENAAAPVGVRSSPDKAHGGQTLVGCDAVDGAADGEEAVELENGVLEREEKVDDEGDVAVAGVAAVAVVDDYEGTVVAVPVAAGLVVVVVVVVVVVAAAAAAAAVYALRALLRGNFEGGQLRSLWEKEQSFPRVTRVQAHIEILTWRHLIDKCQSVVCQSV